MNFFRTTRWLGKDWYILFVGLQEIILITLEEKAYKHSIKEDKTGQDDSWMWPAMDSWIVTHKVEKLERSWVSWLMIQLYFCDPDHLFSHSGNEAEDRERELSVKSITTTEWVSCKSL